MWHGPLTFQQQNSWYNGFVHLGHCCICQRHTLCNQMLLYCPFHLTLCRAGNHCNPLRVPPLPRTSTSLLDMLCMLRQQTSGAVALCLGYHVDQRHISRNLFVHRSKIFPACIQHTHSDHTHYFFLENMLCKLDSACTAQHHMHCKTSHLLLKHQRFHTACMQWC